MDPPSTQAAATIEQGSFTQAGKTNIVSTPERLPDLDPPLVPVQAEPEAAPVVSAPLDDALAAEQTFQELERRMTDNLARWLASGAALEWVRTCQGRWDRARFQALLTELRSGTLWPMKAEEVERAVEEARARWQAEQVPAPEKRKPGSVLTVKIPRHEPEEPSGEQPHSIDFNEPAPPPGNNPRFLSLRWKPVQ